MKKDNNSNLRGGKIAMTVRQFVAEIIRDNFSDLKVTVTDAESHGGLQFVKIFYQGEKTDFKKIKQQIRYELAQRMNQKFVPDLEFVYDSTLETATRIENLLKKL